MITVEHDGATAIVTMARPPVNAIDPDFVLAFHECLDAIERAEPVVVVLRSSTSVFCAGADLALIKGYFDQPDGPRSMAAYVQSLHVLFDRIEALPAVTLAVIDGPALGGGLELALSCDLRIASTRSRLGLPEARVGMIPAAGGTQRLPRLCGPGVAARIILGGELVDGTEALKLGMVQWAVETGILEHEANIIATRIAGLSPQSLALSKRCIAAFSDPARNGFDLEQAAPWPLMTSQEARMRVTKFFERQNN
ncbi:MAG: enoyl-CoA hydratase/isomerase family protein [Notoacmeibacter sp.]|nr:enoyl-CoA hydratase/isomerase family protein [Notoacmeibacter sp.]